MANTKNKSSEKRRLTVGDYVEILESSSYHEEGMSGFISQDDEDERPYQVLMNDGNYSGWLSEDEIRLLETPKRFKSDQYIPISEDYAASFKSDGRLKVGCQVILQDSVLILAEEIKRRRAIAAKRKRK